MLGGGTGMAGMCWLHCRLSLCKGEGVAISCWVHCRLRIFREGEGSVHAGFIVGCGSVRVGLRVYTAFTIGLGCVGREGGGDV